MKYIPAEKLIAEIEKRKYEVFPTDDGKIRVCATPNQIQSGWLNALKWVRDTIASLQQEQPRKRLIQVKCLYPYDESWQKNKVYTCEVWHHGDLNRDFWDVYYDYGKDPRYVQFPSIGLLNEEFVVIQEQPEVDLEKEITPSFVEHLLYEFGVQSIIDMDSENLAEFARHFYELGRLSNK